MEELDEFGIPIKKATSQHSVDEFGIPIKKKVDTTSTTANQKSVSDANTGSLGGVKFPKYDINEYNTKKPIVKKEVNNVVRDKVSTTPVSRIEVSKHQIDRNNEVVKQKVKELTNISKPFTQITPEKEQEVNQDYDNALNKTGVWNKVKQFGTDVLNTSMNVFNKAGMVDEVGDLKLEDPLKKAKEQTLKEAKEQDLSLTNSQFQEKVKDNFTQNRKNEIIHSQLNQFNSDLSPEDRNLLQVDRYNHLTNLDGSQKELLSNTQILKHNRLDTFNEHNALISDINKFVIEGQEPPQELLDKKVSLESNLKDYDSQINKNYQKFSNNKKDIGTFEQELAVYKTEGNDFLNFLGHVKNATLKLGAEGIDFGAYVANVSSNLPSNIPAKILSDYLHDKANKLNESIEEDNATLKQTNTVESPLDFAHKTLNVVADNIPIIAGLTLTGGAGLAGMGATTAGAKFGEMKNEVDKGESNYSNMKMALIPLAWGGTVLAPMATQLKTIQNGARVLESIAKESPELIQKTIKEKAIQYLSDAKTFGKESFKLGNDLKVMCILQEGINHFGLGKDVNYDNLLDLGVYADAPVMHGMGKVAPHLLGMSVKPFMNSTDVKNMDSNSAKIFELTKKLNDESIPKEEKDIIQKSINSIAENSKTIIEGKIKSISETPDLVHKEIVAKTLESSNIRSEALRIKTSDNLTDSEKTIALNELKIKYKQNESDRVDFISGNKTVLDILPQKEVLKLKNEASRELMQEQNPDGTRSVTLNDNQISKRAVEIYNKEVESKKLKDAETESTVTEVKPEVEPKAEVQEQQPKAEKVNGPPPIHENYNIVDTPVVNNNSSLEQKSKEASEKIKRKDLFSAGGSFSNQLGESGVDSVPTNHTEINGIEFVEFSNPNTGTVDVVMSGTSDTDFVGYYRIYENGKPTDKWSSKFENQSRNKENFKTMIGGVQSMLPEGHQYTEKTSISTDGLRVWEQQLSRGYELQTDKNGNVITNEVAINGDAIVNELGIDVNQGNFDNISVTNNQQFQSVKKALLPYLQKLGLNESNIRNVNGTVEIDLPVLRKTKKLKDAETESTATEVNPEIEPKTEVQEPTNAEQEKVDLSSLEKVEYEDFVNNNNVSDERLIDIADKVKNGSRLTPYENSVFTGKTTEINKIIANESISEGNITPNEGVRVGDNADLQQSKVENMQSSSNIGEGKSSIEYAKEQINNGILEWNGDINSPRIDLDMSWADIRKGQADLAKGKENTVPAKRLIEAINNAKELGGYNYKYGTGGENMRAKEFVSFEDLQKTKNEYNLTDAELKEVKDNELENAKKYDEYFNKLSKEEQIDILDDYENRGNTNTGEVSENVNGGEIKENISNEQTKSEREQESVGIEKVISSDTRRERSSEEKAKDLGIDHDKYLDFKDIVEGVPLSGVFKEYVSGKTIEDVFGEKGNNDQSYEAMALLDASTHGDTVLAHAKELFGENYIPKTLEFLQGTKTDNFEKAVVYASLENLMDSLVKENPSDKSLKSLQDLVYRDSQANLSNSSKGLNAGRLRRIHNAIKNGYDVEKMTDQILSDKQKEAKTVLQGIDISGEALNKELDNKEVIDKKFTQEELDSEIKKEVERAKKEWEDANLGFEIRETKVKIKKEEALAQIQKIKDNWRKASKDGTLNASLPYAKQLIAVTPDIVKLANIYRQIGGLKTIDIVESIKKDISDVFESISEKDIRGILKKEFGSKSKKMSEATKRKIYIKLLNKTIESLDSQIEAKKRDVITKEDKYKNDAEIKELRDTKKLKQEELSKIDPSYAESRKLATDLKLAQKSLDEYQRRIDEGDLSTKEKEPKEIDDNLKRLRDARDLKRKEFLSEKKKYDDSLKEPIIPMTKEELADKKYLSDVNNKINSLNKRIEDLKTNKSKSNEGKSTIWNEEISKLENELQNLRDNKKIIKEKVVNVNTKKTKISDIVKQALIDAGFSRDIKIKGEVKKVLDWVKLTGRMNNVDALRQNVEAKLKEQGYTDKQILDINNELEAEYKRLTQNVADKAIADLERRNLIKPSPNRKSDSKRLADLYNQGLFGDNIKKYENVVNSILGFSDIKQNNYEKIKEKAKALSDLYNEKVDGKPITELSISTLASDLQKEISDLLTISAFKQGDVKFKISSAFHQTSSMGMKTLLGGIKTIAENITSGDMAKLLQKMITKGELTKEMSKQIIKNGKIIKEDIIGEGGLDYGNVSTTLISNSIIEDIVSKKLKTKVAHKILTVITLRRWFNAQDSFIKYKLTEPLFFMNNVKILQEKGWSKEDATKHISEALTGDSFEKALVTAKNIIDNVNSKQETKQLRDNTEAIHRFAMDLVRQNLMNDNVMTMEEIQKSFNSAYKGAGSDIGHEANNFIAKRVAKTTQDLSKELNDAINNENWALATLKNVEITIHKTIVSPFAGGGSNWVVIGAEKGIPIVGYIPTFANSLNRTKLDLESETGKKNIEKSLYYDYKTKASFVRNVASTGMAITAYVALYGMSNDDEETNAKKLANWLEEDKNKWIKPYFDKLSPTAFAFAVSLENEEYGKFLAQTLGMNGEVFNNTSKVLKSFDSNKEGATSGAIGKLLGQPINSVIAWKYLLDAINIHRGLKGKSPIESDYELEGFLDGFYQGGFFEATGLVIDNLKGIEQSKKSSSSSSGVKVSKKKFKKYKKF